MKKTIDTFRTVGEALYGSTWQSELARELSVAIRSVQRWSSGTRPIPDHLWPELAQLCLKRSGTLTVLAGKLMQD
jgi:hypothetical protein